MNEIVVHMLYTCRLTLAVSEAKHLRRLVLVS